MESLNIVLEKSYCRYSTQEKQAMAEEKNETYKKLLMQITPADLPKETLATLQELRSRGMLLAIGSSSKNTKLILLRLGLADFFDVVVDGTEISHSKPNPEVFLLAAERLNINPTEAIVVEDAEAGIDAAKAGGFYAIGIGAARESLAADSSIVEIQEILKIL